MRLKAKSGLVLAIAVVLLWSVWQSQSLRARRPREYLPPRETGWIKPNVYKRGDKVDLTVNKVESEITNLPYGYYDLRFVCPPSETKKPLHLSLDEVIRGDRKWESDYNLEFGVGQDCERLCDRKTMPDGLRQADRLIRENYMVHWLIDGDLPAATTFASTRSGKKFYTAGFPLGRVDHETDKTHLHNHLMLVIRYQAFDFNRYAIVGFEVYPRSVSDYQCPGASKSFEPYVINTEETEVTYIPFTYSVYWREESNIDWSHRWNLFFDGGSMLPNGNVSFFYWISLANSAIVVALMTLFIALIFLKIRADDFVGTLAFEWASQPVYYLTQLNLAASMGIQFLFSIIGSFTISCSLCKVHNIRSWELSTAAICFVLGAYTSSLVGSLLAPGPKMNLGTSVLCGCTLPALALVVVAVLNSVVWIKDSSAALPFGTLLTLLTSYFVICLPLSFLGGFSARKLRSAPANGLNYEQSKVPFSFLLSIEYHEYNLLPAGQEKEIPAILSNPFLLTIVTGFPPFVVTCTELLFVYRSLWLQKTNLYSLYGFLLVNFIFLCITVCEVSLVVCYVLMIYTQPGSTDRQASNEGPDIRWSICRSPMTIVKSLKNYMASTARRWKASFSSWRWKAFMAGASVAWYFELYSLYYLIFVLHLRDFSSILLFVCYTSLFNLMCWCAFGALGYLTCLWFLNFVSAPHKSH